MGRKVNGKKKLLRGFLTREDNIVGEDKLNFFFRGYVIILNGGAKNCDDVLNNEKNNNY